jgi:hypothetical protein
VDRFKSLIAVCDPVFLEEPMESLLGEDDVLSRQTGRTAEKDHNFWSNRWIAIKVLQVFPEAVLLEVPLESLLVEEEVL